MRKPIGKKIRFAVFERDGFRCRYCGQSSTETVLHVDHVKAVANGGSDAIDNLVTACIACNLGKGARQLLTAGKHSVISCPFADGWPMDIKDPVFFINKNWAVTEYGLECLATYYPIEARRLTEKRPTTNLSDWLLHIPEKVQFALYIDDFIQAFQIALERHHPHHDLSFLEDTFDKAREIAADTLRNSNGALVRDELAKLKAEAK